MSPAPLTTTERALLGVVLVGALLIRVVGVGSHPAGIFHDEAAAGLDVESLLEHGHTVDPLHGPFFVIRYQSTISMLYRALVIPTVLVGGATTWAVRFPAGVMGTLAVLVMFLWLRRVAGNAAGLAGAALMAFSPWPVMLGRFGHEASLQHVGVVLVLWAVARSVDNGRVQALAAIAAAGALYTYAPARLVVPLMMVGLAWVFRSVLLRDRRALAISVVTGLLIALPLVEVTLARRGEDRFDRISVFNPVVQAHEQKEHPSTVRSMLAEHPVLVGAWSFVGNVLVHFSPGFLFVDGDENLRHHVGGRGELPWIALPLVLAGLWRAARRREPWDRAMLWCLVVAPFGAALTFDGLPHALRASTMIPLLLGFAGTGIVELRERAGAYGKFVLAGAAMLMTTETVAFQADYWGSYQTRSGPDWNDEYLVLSSEIARILDEGGSVMVVNAEPTLMEWHVLRKHPPAEKLVLMSVPQDVYETHPVHVPPGWWCFHTTSPLRFEGAHRVIGTIDGPDGKTAFRLVHGE